MAAESGELIGACEFMKGEEQPPGILRPFHATPPTTPHGSPLCPKPLPWVSLPALCPSVLRLGARAPSRHSTPRGPPASGFFFAFSAPSAASSYPDSAGFSAWDPPANLSRWGILLVLILHLLILYSSGGWPVLSGRPHPPPALNHTPLSFLPSS